MTRQIAFILVLSLLLIGCSSQEQAKKEVDPAFMDSEGYSDRAPETDLSIPQ